MLSFSAYEIHNRVRKQNWKLVMITLNVIPNTLQMFTVRNVNQNSTALCYSYCTYRIVASSNAHY